MRSKSKKFRTGVAPQQALILPFSLDQWLREDHPARALSELIDQLDLSPILDTYQELRGQPPYDPRIMVKVFVYGYAQGVRSSRRIERALYDDVAMRWLSGNQQPDHSRISEFRRRHHEALGNLLVETVRLGKQAGLVGGHDLSADGSKYKAHASKHAAMSYAYMEEEEKRLRAAIERGLEEMEQTDRREDAEYGKDGSGWTLEDDLKFKSRRLERIQKAKAELEARARAEAEAKADEARANGKEVKAVDPDKVVVNPKAQYNFTDPESRIMPASDKKAFIQGYNGQAAVDAESMLVVAADVTIQTTDYAALEPLVDQASANLGETPPAVLADAGYFSKENVAMLQAKGIAAFIPPERIPHSEWRAQPPAAAPVPEDADAREAMRHRLRTPEGRRRYKRRQETVEPTFGHLKEVQGQRQELLRGFAKARSMWRFQCAVYNLKKLVWAGLSANGPLGRQIAPASA
jgi:transposase